jgi:predicted alpha/beta hydrolase family esterase
MTPINKIVFLPGNGCGDIQRANWYATAAAALRSRFGESIEVICETMPDPDVAQRSIWLPHMSRVFRCDEQTLVVGHSSGAVAAMRFLETAKLGAVVLVSAYLTDGGNECERASGYFEDDWKFATQKQNCLRRIVQFGSTDDPFLPIEEQDLISAQLGATYHRFDHRGHFMTRQFPDLVLEIVRLVEEKGDDSAAPAPAPAPAALDLAPDEDDDATSPSSEHE